MLSLGFALPLLVAAATATPDAPTLKPYPPTMVGFGAAIAFSGDDLLVGRPNSSSLFPLPASEKGGVLMFRRGAGGGWTEAASFISSDAELGDGFGSVLAATADRAVVGAPAANEGRGAVYIFTRSGSGWRQIAKLTAPGATPGEQFGSAVSTAGGLVVVGAPGRNESRGAAFAYRLVGSTWSPTEVGRGEQPNDRFGSALVVLDNGIVVGIPGPSPQGGPFGGGQRPRAGAATVYRPTGNGWSAAASLDVGADSTLMFGSAIAASGNAVFVSAPATNGTGAVYEFRTEAGGWSRTGRVAPDIRGGFFGASLAADGDALLVGAPFVNGAKGEVYAYRRVGGAWSGGQKITVDAVGMMIAFGAAAAVKGDLAILAAPGADFFEGIGYVFNQGASGQWSTGGTVIDQPTSLPAITGGERRCETGSIEGFDCQNVDILSFLPTTALGAGRGIMVNDIWGWTDEASGREFALIGRMEATAFVEVTDPSNPVYLGELPLHEGANPNIWRDMKTYKDHAFIVADNSGPHGMQVFDLKRLLSVTNPPTTFTEAAHYDGIASAHNIIINESTGYAYTVGNSGGGETCGGALHMIDLRDPLNPTFAGCFADKSTGNGTGSTHDSQCVTYHGPDDRYRDKEICFNSSGNGVGIAEMTDKPLAKAIAVAAYPNTVFAHQGWLSEDHRHFYLNDEGDEISGKTPRTRTIVWDVADLEEPVLVGEFMGATSATDHNMYVKGNYLFQSNYVAGLRIIDVSDPASLREVGYLDTVPTGGNIPGFAGSWSNYPYFKSGTIIVSSMREGLFVVRHRPERPVP